MTYLTGSSIAALDYNTFATAGASVNEVYSDLHPGATTIAAGADFGYGVTPALSSVLGGNSVLAADWASLFSAMRKIGTHQGTVVTPPVPASGPMSGGSVVALNTPSTMASVVSLLRTNRHNLFPGQTNYTLGTPYTSVSSWLTLMTYSFQANFGSWDNARYFFNSGGNLQIVGTYTSAATPVQLAWRDGIASPKAPFTFNWNSTEPATGTNDAPLNPIGFWRVATGNPLTTSFQTVYRKALGAGYYVASFVQIEAKLAAAAGTNGLVDFKISLIDGDPTPDIKVAGIAFTVNNAASAGFILYPGPPVIITNGGFTYT